MFGLLNTLSIYILQLCSKSLGCQKERLSKSRWEADRYSRVFTCTQKCSSRVLRLVCVCVCVCVEDILLPHPDVTLDHVRPAKIGKTFGFPICGLLVASWIVSWSFQNYKFGPKSTWDYIEKHPGFWRSNCSEQY